MSQIRMHTQIPGSAGREGCYEVDPPMMSEIQQVSYTLAKDDSHQVFFIKISLFHLVFWPGTASHVQLRLRTCVPVM